MIAERELVGQSGRREWLTAKSAMRRATDPGSAELPNGIYAGPDVP